MGPLNSELKKDETCTMSFFTTGTKTLELEIFARIKCTYRRVNPSTELDFYRSFYSGPVFRKISDNSNFDFTAFTVAKTQATRRTQATTLNIHSVVIN